MSKVTKETKYKTTDGQRFDSLNQAEKHQKHLKFLEGLSCEDGYIYIDYTKVSAGDLMDWLEENSLELIKKG